MDLSESQVRQLVKALRQHRVPLSRHLDDPELETADLHVPIAGQLRVLLCDTKLPVLLCCADVFEIDLRIWGPTPAGQNYAPDTILTWTKRFAGWEPGFGHEMSIREYLDTPLGVAAVGRRTSKAPGGQYTPRQLIKWVANKEGAAHLDFRKPDILLWLKSTYRIGNGARVGDYETRRALTQIGHWTVRAIDAVLDRAFFL